MDFDNTQALKNLPVQDSVDRGRTIRELVEASPPVRSRRPQHGSASPRLLYSRGDLTHLLEFPSSMEVSPLPKSKSDGCCIIRTTLCPLASTFPISTSACKAGTRCTA